MKRYNDLIFSVRSSALAMIVAAVALVSSVTALAVPARPVWRILKQPDGSDLKVMTVGDERMHYYVDSEGRALLPDADGFLLPADEKQLADMRATALRLRAASEENVSRANSASKVPHSGSPRIPILLVQYRDYKFRSSNPAATFEEFFNKGNVSAYSYFNHQSRGNFTPQFDVYGPVTLAGRRVDYGGNNAGGIDKGIGKMVAQACLALDPKIDFARYDNNADGRCDVVIILFAGDGEASSSAYDAADAIWPCQWTLTGSDYGEALTLDNTRINAFAVFNEIEGVSLSKIDGIGTFCHEFSHCLGLPDFYDTNYGPHFGMSTWSVMDYGSYNNDGYTPLGYSAYEKEFMGWMEIPEAEYDRRYTLQPLGQRNIPDQAVKLTNPADPNEFYILEARMKRLWDYFMPAEGLLITHFTYDESAWRGNQVNDFDLQRATIIPADNSLKMNRISNYGQSYFTADSADWAGDLWPYGNNHALTDSSEPAARVNTGSFMGKPITEIVRNADGSVSFWAMKGMHDSDGVEFLEDDSQEDDNSCWYSLQGQRLNGIPEIPGLYILASPDGVSRKIMIK